MLVVTTVGSELNQGFAEELVNRTSSYENKQYGQPASRVTILVYCRLWPASWASRQHVM